jgi:hypothetical protein
VNEVPPAEDRIVGVRAYSTPAVDSESDTASPDDAPPRPQALGPSAWVLTTYCVTTVDAARQLRFGAYQLYQSNTLRESGLIHDPMSLSDAERSTLFHYAASHDIDEVRTVREFVEEIFFPYLYDLQGICVGIGLPFLLSRLAVSHGETRGKGHDGGFSLELSSTEWWPRVRVKYLSSGAARISFTTPGKSDPSVPAKRGFFLDVRTL